MKNINKMWLLSTFLLSNYRFEAQTTFGNAAGAQQEAAVAVLSLRYQAQAASQLDNQFQAGTNYRFQSTMQGKDLVVCGFQASQLAQSAGYQLQLSAPGRVINEFGEDFSSPWVTTTPGAPRFEIGVNSASDAKVGLDLGDAGIVLEEGQELSIARTDGSQLSVRGSLRLNGNAVFDGTDMDSWSGDDLYFGKNSSASFNYLQAGRSFYVDKNAYVYARSGLDAFNANLYGRTVVGDPYGNQIVANWEGTFALNAGSSLVQYGDADYNLYAGLFAGEHSSSGTARFNLTRRLDYREDSIYELTKNLPLRSSYTYFDRGAVFRANSLELNLFPGAFWDSSRTVLTNYSNQPLTERAGNLNLRYVKNYSSGCSNSSERFNSSVNYVKPEYPWQASRAVFASANFRF